MAIHSQANLNQSEVWIFPIFSENNLKLIWKKSGANLKSEQVIWTNLNQSEILNFYDFSDYQSEMNLKAIWSQYEIGKVNQKLNSRQNSILQNLNLNPMEKIIGKNMKLNLRGRFIATACLYASIRAASSWAARRSASTCL